MTGSWPKSVGGSWNYNVFLPSKQTNSVGTTWANGATAGSSIRIEKFFIASPADSVATINKALGSGMNLILTPGVYNLDQSIQVTRPDTVVLGLRFPEISPSRITEDDRRNELILTHEGKYYRITDTTTDMVKLNTGIALAHDIVFAEALIRDRSLSGPKVNADFKP
jgi:hypothetical protein